MDGAHDMGGMHGFGPVDAGDDGHPFPEEWESRVFATNLAISTHLGANVDRFRFLIESMAPADYLSSSYYERWLASMLAAVREQGLLSEAELADVLLGRAPQVAHAEVTALPREITDIMANAPAGRQRDMSGTAAFACGDSVRARTMHRAGHTRLPRYLRGHVGTVHSDNGKHCLPDKHADSGEVVMQRLYTVRFDAREIWGEEANPRDGVYADLWESYLESV